MTEIEIGVAAAFADAVDGALHLHGAGVDGGQRIGHGQIAIVVAVDADRDVEGCLSGLGQLGDFLRHGAAVGVAQDDQTCAGFGRGANGLSGVVGIELPAVEEMFGIVDHLAASVAQVFDRLGDHGQVFFAA